MREVKRKIVFDVDDILWGLNKIATDKVNIDYNKIVVYSAKENYLLTEDERKRLLEVYSNPDTFKHINWYDGVEDIIKLEQKGAEVYINSNSFNIEISELKRKQLKSILGLPDDRLILNVLTDCKKKEIGDGVWCFVDDSPHNIASSTAVHNIAIKTPWNTSKHALDVIGDKDIVILDTLKDVINHIDYMLDN